VFLFECGYGDSITELSADVIRVSIMVFFPVSATIEAVSQTFSCPKVPHDESPWTIQLYVVYHGKNTHTALCSVVILLETDCLCH
jgi:hypothetical protein